MVSEYPWFGKCGFILLRPRTTHRISSGWHPTKCVSMLTYRVGSFQDFQCLFHFFGFTSVKLSSLSLIFQFWLWCQDLTSVFSFYLSVSFLWVIKFKQSFWVCVRSFIIVILILSSRPILIHSSLPFLWLSKIMVELSFSVLETSFQKCHDVFSYKETALGSFW